MVQRKAEATWAGDLKSGEGNMKLGTGSYVGSFSAGSRFEDDLGTNPEELLGAAHAGCFSMAFSKLLSDSGYKVDKISTEATVSLNKTDNGFAIEHVKLNTNASVSGIEDSEFEKLANQAKENCPVSRALGSIDIDVEARLAGKAVS